MEHGSLAVLFARHCVGKHAQVYRGMFYQSTVIFFGARMHDLLCTNMKGNTANGSEITLVKNRRDI